jgi:hypothetical protein
MTAFGRLATAGAVVLAAAGLGATPAPAVAVARTSLVQQLTLTGDRTGWVGVDLPRAIVAECPGTAACAAKAALRFSGGAFGYALVYDDDAAAKAVPTVAVIRMPKSEGGRVIAMANGTDPRTGANTFDTGLLPAGRYRLFLLTNGRGGVTVRFPELRSGALTARPTRSTAYRAVETAPQYTGSLAPSAWAGGITIPETGYRSHGYAFDWTDGPVAAASVSSLCVYAGDPPQGIWAPGCPGGESVMANQLSPATGCCGTTYGSVVGGGARFSYGSYYAQAGPVSKAGRFLVWFPER